MSRTKTSCPICDAPPVGAHKPFCSKTCADVDLGRWLGGKYRIPGRAASSEEMARAETDVEPGANEPHDPDRN